MPRIKPLLPSEFPKEMRSALAALRPSNARHPRMPTEDRPKALNTLGTFAHHPELAQAYFTLNGHVLAATTLSERQRELIVMRVAALRQSSYEWYQHLFVARDAGLTDEEIWDVGAITALFAMSNRLAHLVALRPNPEFFLMGRLPRS